MANLPHGADATRPQLILASRSPRRAELLSRLGLQFGIVPAEVDESYVDHEMPAAHAERLAREKASTIASAHPDAIVIGSDTIVIIDSDVLGKPKDSADAVSMLQRLSGREHEVYTAVAIAHRAQLVSDLERVKVRFRTLDREECEAYVGTGEPLDKAGAYGIQGFGSALVESIEGDYFAVMGLPVVRTLDLLNRVGLRYTFGGGLSRSDGPAQSAQR
jgi:septum formation protein